MKYMYKNVFIWNWRILSLQNKTKATELKITRLIPGFFFFKILNWEKTWKNTLKWKHYVLEKSNIADIHPCEIKWPFHLFWISTSNFLNVWKQQYLICHDQNLIFMLEPGISGHLSYVASFPISHKWLLKTGVTVHVSISKLPNISCQRR